MQTPKPDFTELAARIREARASGQAAADACPNDGGSANLDHVVLTGLGRVREATLRKFGIDAYRSRSGFHLSESFGGQGNRRYVGVQAMYKSLREAGVPCFIYYQVD